MPTRGSIGVFRLTMAYAVCHKTAIYARRGRSFLLLGVNQEHGGFFS